MEHNSARRLLSRLCQPGSCRKHQGQGWTLPGQPNLPVGLGILGSFPPGREGTWDMGFNPNKWMAAASITAETFWKPQMSKGELYFVGEVRAILELEEVKHLPISHIPDAIVPSVWAKEHITICYPLWKLQHLLSRCVAKVKLTQAPQSGAGAAEAVVEPQRHGRESKAPTPPLWEQLQEPKALPDRETHLFWSTLHDRTQWEIILFGIPWVATTLSRLEAVNNIIFS